MLKMKDNGKQRLLVLAVMHLFNDGYLAALPLLLPFITADIHIPMFLVGFLSSVLSFSGMLLAIPAGTLAAKRGAMHLLCFAVLLYAFAFIILAAAKNYMLVVLAFIIASIGFGVFHPLAFSSVASSGKTNMGKRMGTFAATGDIGKLAIASLLTFLVTVIGWRRGAFYYGLLALIFFFIVALSIKKENKSKRTDKKLNFGILKKKSFLLANTTSFLDTMANGSVFAFLPFLLLYRGYSTAYIASFTVLFFIGNLLGKVITGYLVDKLGNRRVLIISELLIAIAYICLASTTSLTVIMALSLLLGFLTKGSVPITTTLVAESVEADSFDEAFSLSSFFTSLASTITPLILGAIAGALSTPAVFYITAFFAVMTIISALYKA